MPNNSMNLWSKKLVLFLKNGFVLVLFATLLSGCITRSGADKPTSTSSHPPVTMPDRPPVVVPDEPQIAAYIPPTAPALAKPQPARAVQVLMDRAEDQRLAGNLTGAAGNLERALRIEPRNADLWNQLAHVRVEQKQYAVAREFASKSIATASNSDNALKADNWLIIAKSRRATGDVAGARAAEKKAAALR